MSHKSSASSINQSSPSQQRPVINESVAKTDSVENINGEALRRHTIGVPPAKPPRIETKLDEWELKLYGKQAKSMYHQM